MPARFALHRCPCRTRKHPGRVRTAITISSSDALPARSPKPLIVHSTWRAPFNTADSELATAKSEIVVTVDRPHGLVRIRNALAQLADQSAEMLGQRVADGVGHVDRRRAGRDHLLEDAAQEIDVGAAGVFGGKFNVVACIRAPISRRAPPDRSPATAPCAASFPCGWGSSR